MRRAFLQGLDGAFFDQLLDQTIGSVINAESPGRELDEQVPDVRAVKRVEGQHLRLNGRVKSSVEAHGRPLHRSV
jgi:hypothetical protein